MEVKRKKILVIMFQILKAQEHEWFATQMNRNLFDIEFVMINSKDSHLDKFLKNHDYKVYNYVYSGKRSLIPITFSLFLLMWRNRYDVIHTHLFEANLIGLTSGFLSGVPKRIMTRHSGDYHHVYYPKAVKYDRYCNKLATHIIAISENVKMILLDMEGVKSEKITLIHHGVNFDDYNRTDDFRQRVNAIKSKYSLNTDGPVVGVISRFIEWKGVQYIIPAFRRLLNDFPNAILVLANASGTYEDEILKLLKDLPESAYRLIKFENDVPALYATFNCFVHVPISQTSEAFGQTYIEAMASEIPMIISLSGIASEFAKNEENCLIVPYCDSDAIYSSLSVLLNNHELREKLQKNGYDTVRKYFDNRIKIDKITSLYLK